MRTKKYSLIELREYRKHWSVPRVDLFPADKQNEFWARKKAVDMYIDDKPYQEIYIATGVSHDRIPRLIKKCLIINSETHCQYGYYGLIPRVRVVSTKPSYDKKSSSKSAGAFSALLLKYPHLKLFIENNYYGLNGSSLEKRISPINLHKKFVEECRKLQIQDYEYPFNTADNAQRALYRYLKKLDTDSSNRAILRENKNSRQKFYSTGVGEKLRPTVLLPFSEVQIDGHKIDMLYTVVQQIR